jgi:hypothetical protein
MRLLGKIIKVKSNESLKSAEPWGMSTLEMREKWRKNGRMKFSEEG